MCQRVVREVYRYHTRLFFQAARRGAAARVSVTHGRAQQVG